MPIEYSWRAKAARMDAVRVLLDGGRLALMDGALTTLADVRLEPRSGEVIAGLLVLNGFPKIVEAFATGELTRAALYGVTGELVGGGLTVGTGDDADITVNIAQVTKGNLIKIDAAELRHA